MLYLTPSRCTLKEVSRLIRTVPHDLLYFSSFLETTFSAKPLLLHALSSLTDAPIIIAPRGEFSPGALSMEKLKKKAYITLQKTLGLHKKVLWQASSVQEVKHIRSIFGDGVTVKVAPNLLEPTRETYPSVQDRKAGGILRVVFLSRITPMKNLLYALECLSRQEGYIQFDIYGPMSDAAYWARCKEVVAAMPENVEVTYKGELPHSEVVSTLSHYDLFFLPTCGENFGHAIVEAWQAGCPVLISDRTPWRGLEEREVGWDIPLDQPSRFDHVLNLYLQADAATRYRWSDRARAYALAVSRDDKAVGMNRSLFAYALASRRATTSNGLSIG